MLPATLLRDRSVPWPIRPLGRWGWQGRLGSKVAKGQRGATIDRPRTSGSPFFSGPPASPAAAISKMSLHPLLRLLIIMPSLSPYNWHS
jgi:hypothetical protein